MGIATGNSTSEMHKKTGKSKKITFFQNNSDTVSLFSIEYEVGPENRKKVCRVIFGHSTTAGHHISEIAPRISASLNVASDMRF